MARLPIKLLPIAGIVLIIAAIGFFLVQSEKADVEELSHDEAVPAADISADKLIITLMDSDKGTVLRFEPDKLDYIENFNGEEILLMEDFKAKYQKEKDFELNLSGDSAKCNRTRNEVEVSGGIKGETSDGYMFFTEHLTIKENVLKTDEVVTFVGPAFKVTGKGLFIDLEKKTLKIPKEIFSQFDKESLTI